MILSVPLRLFQNQIHAAYHFNWPLPIKFIGLIDLVTNETGVSVYDDFSMSILFEFEVIARASAFWVLEVLDIYKGNSLE